MKIKLKINFMPIKYKNEKGEEVEAFTQAEVEAREQKVREEASKTAADAASKVADEKAQQAIDEYKKNNPDKSSEIENLQSKLSEAQAKLDAADDGSGGDDAKQAQIERLRKERDQATKDLTEKVNTMSKTIDEMKAGSVNDHKNRLLHKYAGNDKDLRSKLETEFNSYMPDKTSAEEMNTRMEKAATLAGITQNGPGDLDISGGMGAGMRGDRNTNSRPVQVTENAKAIGQALGVSEDDLKKQATANQTKKDN